MDKLKSDIYFNKNFIISLLILVSNLFISFSIFTIKSHNAITTTSLGLKGPVRLLVTNGIEHGHMQGSIRYIEYDYFNKKGQLIESRFYYPKTRLVHDSEFTWLTYYEEVNGKYTGLDTSYFIYQLKEIYNIGDNNKKKFHQRFNANGVISFYETYVYNEKDSLIKEIYYRMDDNGICTDTSTIHYHYTYFSNKVFQTTISSENDTTTKIFTFENGRIISEEFLWNVNNEIRRNMSVFRYDKKGNRVQTLSYYYEDNNYKLYGHETRTFKKNKLVSLIDSTEHEFTKFRFYYNSKSKVLVKDENSTGSQSKSTAVFDKYDNIIKENHEWQYDGEITQQQSQSQTIYTYDVYGNWISKEVNVFENNSSEIKVSNRRFEYYNL